MATSIKVLLFVKLDLKDKYIQIRTINSVGLSQILKLIF
ncbi:hypothetical protein C21_01131 [Arenibacter sp. NBRC 103722]|uniref:Uncharacterized protein n=1 Tax=Arenibacter algicola TaxID=616991 RepID=A0A221V194_9FLAO|nr:hypothetical protein AREALGSMS7_03885 [Arenibacter algicola]GBF18966.1 hypothetical protein C21_01131 [Arenibacter sp. NBRC 103722]